MRLLQTTPCRPRGCATVRWPHSFRPISVASSSNTTLPGRHGCICAASLISRDGCGGGAGLPCAICQRMTSNASLMSTLQAALVHHPCSGAVIRSARHCDTCWRCSTMPAFWPRARRPTRSRSNCAALTSTCSTPEAWRRTPSSTSAHLAAVSAADLWLQPARDGVFSNSVMSLERPEIGDAKRVDLL